jgi:N-acetylglucosaminyldiphosphoundecaprenol N-acetyl-beta-D-mannosaminyltransferase
MPLVWFSRWFGMRPAERVYGPDLMRSFTALSAKAGYRHFYYGGGEGVAESLRAALLERHPGLQVVGTFTPPFRAMSPDEELAAIEAINAAAPDIVWVGLSTPKQERWMADHRAVIEAPVMVGVGAAFDFLSGRKRQAPRWIQDHGLEWLFRLCSEPRRLWRRYAYIVPGFLIFAAVQIVRSLATDHPARQ